MKAKATKKKFTFMLDPREVYDLKLHAIKASAREGRFLGMNEFLDNLIAETNRKLRAELVNELITSKGDK
jgi:hypothetical protein